MESLRIFDPGDSGCDVAACEYRGLRNVAARESTLAGVDLSSGDSFVARSAVLHAIDDGAARHAGDGVHANRTAIVLRGPARARRGCVCCAGSDKRNRGTFATNLGRRVVVRSAPEKRGVLLRCAVSDSRRLVFRAVADDGTPVRRCRLHALQHRIRTESGPGEPFVIAPLLLSLPG